MAVASSFAGLFLPFILLWLQNGNGVFGCEIPLSEQTAVIDMQTQMNGSFLNKCMNGGVLHECSGLLDFVGCHVYSISWVQYGLTGSISSSIGNLTGLSYFALTQNQIGGSVPKALLMLESIENINLSQNNFSGILPNPIESAKLRLIQLQQNRLEGPIPDLSGSRNLTMIDFSYNKFTGPVHANLFPAFLKTLYLRHNKLEGEIPQLNSTHLFNLDLSSNKFSGMLPSSFESLTNLLSFNISHNALYGALPQMSQTLSLIDIRGNNFCGVYPPAFCSASKLYVDKQNFLCDCQTCSSVNITFAMRTTQSAFVLIEFNITSYRCEGMEIFCSIGQAQSVKAQHKSDSKYLCQVPFVPGVTFNLALTSNAQTIHTYGTVALPDCDMNQVVCNELSTNCYCRCPLFFNRNKMDCKGANILAWSLTGTAIGLIVLLLVGLALRVLFKRLAPTSSSFSCNDTVYEKLTAELNKLDSKVDSRIVDILKNKFRPFHWVLQKDQIKLGARIGTGSFAVVFHGVLRDSTQVAVKQFYNLNLEDQSVNEIMNEIATWEMLKHPNILMFLGACLDDGALSVVSEYMENKSLAHVLRKHHFSWDRKLVLCTQVASGLCYLHNRKPPVIHRDIKPANILLDSNFTAKIADFGMSRTFDILHKQQTMKGTMHWMAPEIIEGEDYGLESDVFSFGIVMWNVLTDTEVPFPSNVNPFKVTQGLRPVVPSLSDLVSMHEGEISGLDQLVLEQSLIRFVALMQACWAQQPQDRPTMQMVWEQLEVLCARKNS